VRYLHVSLFRKPREHFRKTRGRHGRTRSAKPGINVDGRFMRTCARRTILMIETDFGALQNVTHIYIGGIVQKNFLQRRSIVHLLSSSAKSPVRPYLCSSLLHQSNSTTSSRLRIAITLLRTTKGSISCTRAPEYVSIND